MGNYSGRANFINLPSPGADMKFRALIVIFLFLLSALPVVAAANSLKSGSTEDIIYHDRSEFVYDDIPSSTILEKYVCGYSLDRLVRGDCSDDGTVYSETEAPGERWFRFDVPANSIGDVFKLKLESEIDPHKVDLSVDLCRTNPYIQDEVQCKALDDMYGEDTQYTLLLSTIPQEYWIHVVAWDEEKEGQSPGGDLTKIRISVSNHYESDDSEPTPLANGQKVEKRVCEIGCSTGSTDIIDIFTIDGFTNETIDVHFGSRENDVWGHNDLRVTYFHDYDFFNSNYTNPYYLLDDYYHYDNLRGTNDEGVSKLTYRFDTSGTLYVVFEALVFENEDESESYTIEFIDHDHSDRDETADRDQDGLPDYEEHLCGSDFRDPTDTVADWDEDNVCDLRDEDDDNDGILDEVDTCPFSLVSSDHDNDGCTDEEDGDDDNDGIVDLNDLCPTGAIGVHSADADGDGCGDDEDTDDDNDEWSDINEVECETDPLDVQDFPNNFDADYELYYYSFSGVMSIQCDLIDDDDDADGVVDTIDDCLWSQWYQYNTATSSLITLDYDVDGDGCFNVEDPDDDGDSILDENDLCPTGLTIGGDLDGDGCKDAEDSDIDGDSYSKDIESQCGTSDFDPNSRPIGEDWDFDGDGVCDEMDPDDDGDGVFDTMDLFPKNPEEQYDFDSDGVGDNSDVDDDGDGVADEEDDMPFNKEESTDTDNDGIGNNADPDDDNDLWLDEKEDQCQTNPLDAKDRPSDMDGDGTCDLNDVDIDGDDHDNIVEEACGSDPYQGLDVPDDWDGDKTCDAFDDDDDNDGIDDEPDECPRSIKNQFGDMDSDGCFDSEDDDMDGDGKFRNKDECPAIPSLNENGCPTEVAFYKNPYVLSGAAFFVLILVGVLSATRKNETVHGDKTEVKATGASNAVVSQRKDKDWDY